MFKTTKQVITPVFQLVENVPLIVTFLSAFYIGEKVEKDKEPATLARVVSPVSGEIGLIVANEVLKSTLVKEYPNDGYIKKTFEITKLPKREGKAYNGFRVNEGEYTADPLAPAVGSAESQTITANDVGSQVPGAAGSTAKKK